MASFQIDLQGKPYIFFEENEALLTGEGQCDCACVEAIPVKPLARMFNQNKKYSVAPNCHRVVIDSEHDVSLGLYGGAVLLNKAASQLLNAFSHSACPLEVLPEGIQEEALQVVKQMFLRGLLVSEYDSIHPMEPGNDRLTAWLHISDRCNLRCSYCYLPHQPMDMSLETGQQAIAATFRSAIKHGFKAIKFKYAGGEPLLRFPLVKTLQLYAQELAAKHHLALDAVVLSNGTLLSSTTIHQMQQLNLRLMVSLDGLGRFHDEQRPLAGGHGSFADTARGIELALSLGLKPDISVTVTSQSADGLAEVIYWILERELPFSLNFYRENELSKNHQALQLQEQKIITGMLAAFKMIENHMPPMSLLGSLVDRANLAIPHEHTCGVGQSYLVFDYQGKVAKCQMHFDQAVTTSDAEDPLGYIQVDQIGIQNISVAEKEGCRDCHWKNWCAGGCPLTTFRATGRYDVKSPNCNIYKTLYPEALKLEGLRLLKKLKQSS